MNTKEDEIKNILTENSPLIIKNYHENEHFQSSKGL
jgi:hypothetical protein